MMNRTIPRLASSVCGLARLSFMLTARQTTTQLRGTMPRPSTFVFAAAPPKASMVFADCASNLSIIASSMKMVPIIGQALEGAVQTVQKLCERIQVLQSDATSESDASFSH